ncbi:TPA: hypothetical protein QEM98_000037 [Stenotrophomonas maltophilia]|uniref:hypothetical protein n=1 Tax=Stenotrophomonas TaxID=40323 RepID=UPI000C25EA73|nr:MULTISPECIES: hypothetical protein [Stenotrophomonas]BBO53633.1 hypothetical protein KMM349_39640 [Stenotrophomonas maltophilia]HDS1833958.1 hypothetical protein [Stenotrophomonas maltophilia]
MGKGKHGLQVFDESGSSLVEVGPHVVVDRPEFGAAIGSIATAWAQAEVNLLCLLAVLINTTPELVKSSLKKHRSAKSASEAARKIATETLDGAALQDVVELLSALDKVRDARNRVQHDVWARKATDSERLYRVHSDQYLALALKLLDVERMNAPAAAAIEVATSFAAAVSEGYSVSDLNEIADDIDSVSKRLLTAMFSNRICQLKALGQVDPSSGSI